jgi:hypothetical protein
MDCACWGLPDKGLELVALAWTEDLLDDVDAANNAVSVLEGDGKGERRLLGSVEGGHGYKAARVGVVAEHAPAEVGEHEVVFGKREAVQLVLAPRIHPMARSRPHAHERCRQPKGVYLLRQIRFPFLLLPLPAVVQGKSFLRIPY